jgi:hypothetical protein
MRRILLVGAVLTATTAAAMADVALVTIPRREGTQLTIYNSEDITMVREHRLLTVKKGVNRIQFSWANTLIDPTSIDFRILEKADQVDLIDTTFPAGRTDALQWNIESKLDGKIAVEIRYFTSGITWTADYVGIADQAEKKLDLTGYVRVYNNSGELYENAEVRLVVGTINLVEKIAALATAPPPGDGHGRWRGLKGGEKAKLQEEVTDALGKAEKRMAESKDDADLSAKRPAKVVKEGLSEYFLFTVEGRQELKHAEPTRMVSMKVKDVPLECFYKLSDRTDPANFNKFYRFKNLKLADDAGKPKKLEDMENLGVSPLPDGMVRLFFEYANKDLAYVGGTATKYVPIGDRVEVNVGADPDITVKRRMKDVQITNIKARQYKRRIDNTWVLYYDLVDYDETFTWEEEHVSGKPVVAKTEVERRFDASVVLWSPEEKPKDWDKDEPGAYVDLHKHEGRVERVDQNHVKYFLDLQPGLKRFVTYTVTVKHRKEGPELNTERKREPL